MKQTKKILLLASLLTLGSGAWAQEDNTPIELDEKMVGAWEGDTLIQPLTEPLLTSKIRLVTRSHGDRVVLRWLAEDYVSWRALCQSGVNVLRQDRQSRQVDTLALGLKPLTQQQFEARYPQSDSLAMIAMGTLYGEGRTGYGQTREKPGSQGANVELNNEQDLSFAYAMLVAEWRPDLAEALAVGLTDRTARRGGRYDYYIQPSTTDFAGRLIFEPGVSTDVENVPYKAGAYNPSLHYELVSPRRIAVSWVDSHHSSYEVERREQGSGSWQRLNERPYLSMVQDTEIDGLCIYSDSVPHDGTWEYRIMGHDAFGELTTPSPTLTAYARDIEAPHAPQLTRIIIERPDSLRAIVLPTGHVVLSWLPKAEDTDIAYFDVAFANDSTHKFLQLNQGGLADPMFIDSLALDVNQKYVYYKVRAVDTENNFGPWTPALEVVRPHDTPPTAPHLDESWHNDRQGMHMRWIVGTDADMDHHLLLRRLGTDGPWELVARWDADSLRQANSYAISVDDNPPYDQSRRYYYLVESHNSTPYTSRSLAVSWQHRGPRILDIPITLSGAWVEHEGLARLTWDARVDASLQGQDYYFCIFRKGPSDKRFLYMYNVAKDEQEYTDQLLKAGEQAEYYVVIQFKDGRESQQSNTVSIKRIK